jgi:nucleotide-binding universal stress UspA family protein
MNLLSAIDFSETTDQIIRFIKKFAPETKMKIYLVHVVQPEPDFIGYSVGPESERDFIARKFHEKHIHLQELAEKLKNENVNVIPLLIQGPTIQTILQEAEKLKVDFIVTGSHGHSHMVKLIMGSISKGLVKHSQIPVLIVPSKELQQ